MSISLTKNKANFVVAIPGRSSCDNFARFLQKNDLLRLYAIATRRGTEGISDSVTSLNPFWGLLKYIAQRSLSVYYGESFRFALHPLFDLWVKAQLKPGDNIISSYGYANASFKWAQQNGGKTFLQAGNSHPDNFWNILVEEHKRWGSRYLPVARFHYERSRTMLDFTDYVFAVSGFVEKSFLERGFAPSQVFRIFYPVDLSCFKSSTEHRAKDRPLTIINTGGLSLRKGSPYLLEAYRIILKEEPGARLLLFNNIRDDMKPMLAKYRDLPITWFSFLRHPELADKLRSADIFVLPSIEDGFAKVVTEALSCGLPVITTLNTGASDFIIPGKNGEIVPIRDAKAIADSVLKWWGIIKHATSFPVVQFDADMLSITSSEKELSYCLKRIGIL